MDADFRWISIGFTRLDFGCQSNPRYICNQVASSVISPAYNYKYVLVEKELEQRRGLAARRHTRGLRCGAHERRNHGHSARVR